MTAAALRSPYRGLTPYAEDDWAYFFGRDEEVRRLMVYLDGSTLTVLYGASGVGKSSLLRAGLEHELLERARASVQQTGKPSRLVCVLRHWSPAQARDPVKTVVDGVLAAWESTGAKMPPPPSGSLAEVLDAWAERAGGSLFLVLDQFEEYLLYHGSNGGLGELGEQLAELVNDSRSRVSVMLSLREDALARLDRFKRAIPRLLDNYLRVEHLSLAAAAEAIDRPLPVYRERVAREGPESVEPSLRAAVLDEVRVTPQSDRVEAPYLQLLMRRLWHEALVAGSPTITLETLKRVGDSRQIVRTHVDEAMNLLPLPEQDAAARIFHQLVTPSGSKIAHAVEDLAAWADLPETALTSMLATLSEGETRLLRSVPPPLERPFSKSYEIFHDVLARPVLDWCAAHELEVGEARTRVRSAGSGPVLTGEADGVFGAGGIRLLGLVGALQGFAEHPTHPIERWVNVAGAGGGAVVAALLACDHDASAIRTIALRTNFAKVTETRFGALGLWNLLSRGSLSQGKAVRAWLDELFEGRTFGDVKTDGGRASRLRLIAADVTHATMLVLPDDLPSYRRPDESEPIDPDSFPLADAVRMSMSIPFLFPPVDLVHVETEQRATIVDGAIFADLPVWLFDLADRAPTRPTIGLRVRGARGSGDRLYDRFAGRSFRLALDIFRTASEASDSRFMARSARVRTCIVDAGEIGTTEFSVSRERAEMLVASGRDAARAWLDRFDPAEYVNVYGLTFTSAEPSAVA